MEGVKIFMLLLLCEFSEKYEFPVRNKYWRCKTFHILCFNAFQCNRQLNLSINHSLGRRHSRFMRLSKSFHFYSGSHPYNNCDLNASAWLFSPCEMGWYWIGARKKCFTHSIGKREIKIVAGISNLLLPEWLTDWLTMGFLFHAQHFVQFWHLIQRINSPGSLINLIIMLISEIEFHWRKFHLIESNQCQLTSNLQTDFNSVETDYHWIFDSNTICICTTGIYVVKFS